MAGTFPPSFDDKDFLEYVNPFDGNEFEWPQADAADVQAAIKAVFTIV